MQVMVGLAGNCNMMIFLVFLFLKDNQLLRDQLLSSALQSEAGNCSEIIFIMLLKYNLAYL